MKTAPTNKKIRELITLVNEGRLIPRPEFQRRLVWKIEDKNHFLDSVLNGYPFPEIYIADGDVDLDTGNGTQLLVDGLQRISTLVQYFKGDEDLKLTTVMPYRSLTDEQKSSFLLYDVAVRDLGTIPSGMVVEVFRRLNATSYSLTDMEINNAIYRGAFKEFCEKLSLNKLLTENRIFSALDYRRMGDLKFAIQLVITVLYGYFNRDDLFQEFLERYNDEFPESNFIEQDTNTIFEFIEECGFDRKSRIWRKTDLFTVFIELFVAIIQEKIKLEPSFVVESLNSFFDSVENGPINQNSISSIYYKSAIQASNDRLNRVRRGMIIGGILRTQSPENIMKDLSKEGLI